MDRQCRKAWQKVLDSHQDKLVGGEIEFLEGEPDGEIYRGPIEEIKLTEPGLFVKLGWVAQLGVDGGSNEDWVFAPWECPALLITSPPETRHETIQFRLPRGCGWIYPVGTEQIPRSEIRNLAA